MQDLISADFLFDKGNGIEKGRVLQAEIIQADEEIQICLKPGLGFLPMLFYWHPFDYPAVISIKKINGACIIGHNAYKVLDDSYYFILDDSFFYLKPEADVVEITISCNVKKLDVCDQRQLMREREMECDKTERRLLETEEKVEKLTQDLNCVVNSTIWKKTEPLRRWKDGRKDRSKNEASNDGIVKKYDSDTAINELIYTSMDVICIKDGLLTLEGWVICVEHEIRSAQLVLVDDCGIRHLYDLELKGRRDVADTLGVRFTGDCGINFCADYKSYSNQKILLNLNIEGKWYETDTEKVISATAAAGGDFYLEKYYDGEPPLDYWRFYENNIGKTRAVENEASEWKADVVVPIYNGMRYLPKLFEGIEKTRVDYRLILIDDCSPDEEIYPYLKKYAERNKRVVLFRNEENLGFVASVNRALKETVSHVVLVNTDVELPDRWLERMLAPVYTEERVASVTPFTNSATIFSFPKFCEDNPLFLGLDVDTIDAAFQKVSPRYTVTPTGVGFCMTLNREVISAIGVLDAETFQMGYGEENDWCQRAMSIGYHNVYAENLFVYHNHGGSFQSETKKRLLKENGKRLLQKHPNYQLDVEDFCRRDPNRDIRTYVKFELMFHSDIPLIMAFDHDLGGGAASYLDEKLALELEEGRMVAIVRYNKISDRYTLKLQYGENDVQIVARNRKEIMKLLQMRSYEQIWINELATYRELQQWLLDIITLRDNNTQYLKMLIHDYFSVCPSLNLVDASCRYCGLPDDAGICEKCLSENQYIYNDEYHDIVNWRQDWARILKKCDEIIVFSKDSQIRLQDVYPELQSVRLIPHHVEPLPAVHKECKTTETVNIGILGAISGQKGLGVLKQMIAYLEEHREVNMHLVLIGEAAVELNSSVLTITGHYKREDIPELTKLYDIDAFFIPSIWPETFSYTTAEVMFMELPIAVYDIGAPAERVRHYEKGLIIDRMDEDISELVMTLFKFAKEGTVLCRQ